MGRRPERRGPQWAIVPNVAKSVVPVVAVPSDPVPSDVAPLTSIVLTLKMQPVISVNFNCKPSVWGIVVVKQ